MRLRHQIFAIVGSAVLPVCGATAQDSADRIEVLDTEAARMQARTLLPTFANKVMDGERRVNRTAQWVRYLGLLYRFRLYPEPVPLRPFCEMRTLSLDYDFVQPRDESGPPQDYDLMTLERAGAFKSGTLTTQSHFLELAQMPRSEDEHRALCRTAADVDGWLPAENANAFASERWHLAQLRVDLASDGNPIKLVCVRDREFECPVSREILFRAIDQIREDFREITLSDGTGWIEFRYPNERLPNGGYQAVSVILEKRLNKIATAIIVYNTIAEAAL